MAKHNDIPKTDLSEIVALILRLKLPNIELAMRSLQGSSEAPASELIRQAFHSLKEQYNE